MRILQEPELKNDGDLLRGTVIFIYMSLWGPHSQPLTNLNCPYSCVLPSILQICAFIPVDGISGCPHDLKFRWRSYKTIYTLLVLLLQTIYTLITIIYATKNEKNFNSFVLVLWNFRCVLSLIAFLKVAQKWPRFMQEWSEMELFMIDYPSFLNLNRNLRIKSIVFLLPGLFEHLLFIYKGFQQISHTTEGKNNPLKIYFEQMYKEVFDLINFNPIVAIMVEYCALISTYMWQFVDFFIVILSFVMAQKFREINSKIKTLMFQDGNWSTWKKIREDYDRLCKICNILNDIMNDVVLIAFLGNIYFLSVIFYESLEPREGFKSFYYIYNVLFNGCHFIAICMYGSFVHDESLKSFHYLTVIPSNCPEVERLINQIQLSNPGIHGYNLFKIKRNTILLVANWIVTVQLILLEYHTKIARNIQD